MGWIAVTRLAAAIATTDSADYPSCERSSRDLHGASAEAAAVAHARRGGEALRGGRRLGGHRRASEQPAHDAPRQATSAQASQVRWSTLPARTAPGASPTTKPREAARVYATCLSEAAQKGAL